MENLFISLIGFEIKFFLTFTEHKGSLRGPKSIIFATIFFFYNCFVYMALSTLIDSKKFVKHKFYYIFVIRYVLLSDIETCILF